MSDRFLAGRIAWVTDGVGALGRAIALALAEAGASVAFGAVPSPKEAAGGAARAPGERPEPVADALRGRGGAFFHSALDLRNDGDVDRFHRAAVDALGPVDVLVNSAAVSAREEMIGHRNEVWSAVLDVNLHGSYRTVKRCMGSMVERRFGRIVNIASPAAETGYPAHSAYCASMSALLGLTRCVALEGAEHGVTCNVVQPGWLDTAAAAAPRQADLEVMPERRLIPPEEVASFVLFLCCDEALGLTGEAVAVTGGTLHVTEDAGRGR
jgi:3-hydroxybutyrate dehydrogenase